MGKRGLTVRDRIIVHLLPFSRNAEDFECPPEMCQEGIAAAIGKSRAHVTLELGRMKGAGLLRENMAHVTGARAKRKVYALTAAGQDRGRQITEHLRKIEVEMRDSNRTKVMNGSQAAEALAAELALSWAMACDMVMACDRHIDLDGLRAAEASRRHADFREYVPDAPEGTPGSGQTLEAHVLRANILSKRGRSAEALEILGEALRMFGSDPERHRLHYSIASIHRKQGDFQAALTAINKSLSLAGESGNTLMVGRCQMEKAMILHGRGSLRQSLRMLESALDIFKSEDSQVDVLRCELNLGIVLRCLGELVRARESLENALRLAGKTGSERLEAYALVNLADLLNGVGEFQRAGEIGRKAADIFRVLDEPLMLAAALFNLGIAQAGLGECEEAISNLETAISVLEGNGLLASRSDWLERYAAILESMGMPEKARTVLERI